MTYQFIGFRISEYDGVVVPPMAVTLGYTNQKMPSSTHWYAELYNVNTHSWTPSYVPEKIGILHAFPGIIGTFLAVFQESYNVYYLSLIHI